MAEVLGAIASGITIAALFKTCINAFDLIQTSRNQDIDFKKLKLRLNIEKCRLYNWGESMGLTDVAEPSQERPIDKVHFPDLIRGALEILFELFQDSQKIKGKYGCKQATTKDLLPANQTQHLNHIASSFSNFAVRSALEPSMPRSLQKVVWVIHDRKKFGALVTEIKELVDGLLGLTNSWVPLPKQSRNVRRRIVNIQDAETLSLIAEVCSDDHPDIAGAASTKADTISLTSTHQRHVAAWLDNVQDGQVHMQGRDMLTPDIESLTTTELKHKLLQMMKEKERETLPTILESPIILPADDFVDSSVPWHELHYDKSTTDLTSDINHNCAIRPKPKVLDQEMMVSTTSDGLSNVLPTEKWQPLSSETRIRSPWGVVSSDIFPLPWSPYPYPSAVEVPWRDRSWSQADSLLSLSSQLYWSTEFDSITSDLGSCKFDSIYSPTYPLSVPLRPSTPQSITTNTAVIGASSDPDKENKSEASDTRITRSGRLYAHNYSHLGEKPYFCAHEGCIHRCSTAQQLRRHRKVHQRSKSASGDVEMKL